MTAGPNTLNNAGGRQLTYGEQEVPLLAGMLAYVSLGRDNIYSYLLSALQATLDFGLGVVLGSDGGVRLPFANIASLVFSGDFVTSNVINLKVNGVAISPVTFNTDSDTTLGLLADAIAAMDGVDSAVADPSSHSILVTMDEIAVAITNIAVTLGSGQVTGAATYSSADQYVGQPVRDPLRVSGDGFEQSVEIAVARNTAGVVVLLSADVTKGEAAYLDISEPGRYTNVAAGNIPVKGQFNTDGVEDDLAVVIINQP